jgi:prepilin-type N-terminal cleavage/methylation domain-containing protein
MKPAPNPRAGNRGPEESRNPGAETGTLAPGRKEGRRACPSGLGFRPSDFFRPSGIRVSDFRRAFTLIELMIVIGIVAIIVASGVPPFVKALRKEGLRKAVSDTVEACSHARAQAILHGAPTELVIRAEDGQITVRPLSVQRAEGGGDGRAEGGGKSGSVKNFTSNLPDDIAVKSLDVNFKDQMQYPEAHVRFFPNGSCDEFAIILTATTGEQLIHLDVITGLANVTKIR